VASPQVREAVSALGFAAVTARPGGFIAARLNPETGIKQSAPQ
jgi:hypothetical protein